jgi:hypothetical protein
MKIYPKQKREKLMPTIRLDDETWEKFEEGCVELTIIRRKPVTVPEVAKYIISEYQERGIKKMIEIEKKNKK